MRKYIFLLSQLQNSLRSNCGEKHAYLPIIRKVHRINAMHIYERSTNLRILRSKFNSNIVLQLALLLFVFGLTPYDGYASAVTPQTVALAQQALPIATGSLSDVASMSKLLPYMLRLPAGIAKAGLSVLPGVTLQSGLKDIGTGLYATSVFTKGTLGLPFKVLRRSLNQVSRISPSALAGL